MHSLLISLVAQCARAPRCAPPPIDAPPAKHTPARRRRELQMILSHLAAGDLSAADLMARTGHCRSTLLSYLQYLVAAGQIERRAVSRSTVYRRVARDGT